MKYLKKFLIVTLLIFFQKTFAHPGIGLVINSKGNIFYTDLKNIWMQTPNGEKTIAVENVHSHELYMDKNDNLFGEHYWYEPEEKWFKYEWCLTSMGELKKITDTIQAYINPQVFSFVRDNNGNMYWYEKVPKTDTFNFIRKDTFNSKKVIASGVFKNIRWLFSTPNGEIYFLDLDDLYKIEPNNKFNLIAKNLCMGTPWTLLGKKHSVFGVWFDKDGNTFAAVSEDGCIKKIAPNGNISIVYKSKTGSPVNGLFDKEGNLWVLEGMGIFKSQVVKVQLTELNKANVWFTNNKKYIYWVLGIVAATILFNQIRRKNANR